MLKQLLILAALIALAIAKCEPGWQQFESKCYLQLYHHQHQTISSASIGSTNVAKGSINHPTAQANCTSKNANLLSVHSEAENNFVKGLLHDMMEQTGTGGTFHIGMMFSRSTSQGTGPVTSAVWMDGAPVDYGNPAASDFQAGTGPWSDGNWRDGKAQPDGDGLNGKVELCVMMPQNQAVNGEWEDVSCSTLGGLICNKLATK